MKWNNIWLFTDIGDYHELSKHFNDIYEKAYDLDSIAWHCKVNMKE